MMGETLIAEHKEKGKNRKEKTSFYFFAFVSVYYL